MFRDSTPPSTKWLQSISLLPPNLQDGESDITCFIIIIFQILFLNERFSNVHLSFLPHYYFHLQIFYLALRDTCWGLFRNVVAMRAGLSVMAIKTVTNTLDPRPDFFEMQIFYVHSKIHTHRKKNNLAHFYFYKIEPGNCKERNICQFCGDRRTIFFV